jgi:WD40 repeat protein
MSFLVVEGKAPASSGGPQGEVLLWDVNSGKLKQKLGKAARLNDMSAPDLRELYPATGVAIWPNGRTVAVASYIAYVRFWDINTGQYQPPLLSFRGTIEGIAFSPKGDWFAVARSNEALLYDTAWGKEDSGRSFRAEKGHIRGVLFSPDGAKLVTVGSSEVVVWDVQTGTRVHTLETETDSHAAAFSLDGRFIAVASGIEVLLWDQITGEVIQKITTGESQSPVAFSRDASILATGGQNNEVLLWSVL